MGRLPNTGIFSVKNQSCFNDMRKRHRDADCKYRSKVQYLYFKIKSLIRKKTAKDGLLDNALGFIQELESEIYEKSDSDHMENCKKEFLNFLLQEELIWKKEKDVTKWWTMVDDLLSKDHPLIYQKEFVSMIEDDKKHSKSVKRPYSRKSLKSSKHLHKNSTSCSCCVNEHMPTLPFNEESLNIYVDKSVRNNEVFSSSWNVPEVTNFRPLVSSKNKGDSAYKERILNNSISSNSDDIFTTGLPLEVTCVAVPVDNSSINVMEYPQQTQSSVVYL